MVQTSSRLPRRNRIIATTLAVLLVTISLTACSTHSDTASATVPTATSTSHSSATSTTSTPTIGTDPTEPAATPTPSEESAPIETISPDVFTSEVTSLVDQVEGLVEVVVALPDGSIITDINGHEPMEAASLYKLAILVEVYAQREMGELSFDEEILMLPDFFTEEDSVFSDADIDTYVTIDTLLYTMVTLSSNVAATALLGRVGNENVNLTMASLGLESTEIRWAPGYTPASPEGDDAPAVEESPDPNEGIPGEAPAEDTPAGEEQSDDEGAQGASRHLLGHVTGPILLDERADSALNVTNASDIAALYVMLVNGQLVSEMASQEMIALLEQQQINDRLPAYLPADTVVAHKTGNLDGLVHDAGIIFAPAGPVVVVVMTENVEEWQATDLIATIAQLAYESGLHPAQ